MKKVCIRLILVCLMNVIPSAYAFDFSGVGALTLSNGSYTPSQSTSLGVGYGLGGLVGVDLNPFFSIEGGALFLNHSFSANSITNSYNFVDIPVMLRFSPISLIALNIGVYYGIAASASNSSGNTLSNTNDYGLIGGLGARIPLVPLMKLRIDFLYEYGLANLGSANQTLNSRNIDILVGVMFDM